MLKPEKTMKFTKMHGIGTTTSTSTASNSALADPVRHSNCGFQPSHRHRGDGLILILPSDKADVRMRMFNADGSEAEMCGNGIRCVAKYYMTTSEPKQSDADRDRSRRARD